MVSSDFVADDRMNFRADYGGAILHPSPNYDERPQGDAVSLLIIHYTGMESAAAAEHRLALPESKVSAHYVVREDGRIVQMVAEEKCAWHAGESAWQGRQGLNSCSIGIELVNPGPLENFPDFPDAQIAALILLSQDIITRHGIKPRHVLAHSDIAPGRKNDPGEKFPWHRLAAAGVGHYVQPVAPDNGRLMVRGESGRPVEAFQSMLALYGYDLAVTGLFDEKTEEVTRAFQRHFRPQRVDGIADLSTVETLHRLLASLDGL